MTDRPIIFSGSMVRALLDGRKTQTRRLASSPLRQCQVGDRLYVRESGILFDSPLNELFRHDVPATVETGFYWVRSKLDTGASYSVAGCSRAAALLGAHAKVRPSIHMPRWASRLTLTVTDVRVQPLKECSDHDAIAEGTSCYICDTGRVDGTSENDCGCFHSRDLAVPSYRYLWDSLHTKEGQRWEDNPDVVAITFQVANRNIDHVG
jgi:hypothetical protein